MKDKIPPIDKQIAAYLWGDMEPEEKATFEKRLADNPDLQEALDLQRTAKEQRRQEHLRQQFRNNLQTAQTEIAIADRRKKLLLQILAAIALVAVLVAIGWFFWPKPTPAPPPVITPPPAVAENGGDEGEPLVGASRKEITYQFKAPLLRFAPAADSLTIKLVEDTRQKAFLEPNVLALHFLPDQIPDEKNIKLIELTIKGRRVLYLKLGKSFYPLQMGEQELVDEEDELVLRWLNFQD